MYLTYLLFISVFVIEKVFVYVHWFIKFFSVWLIIQRILNTEIIIKVVTP